MKKYLVQHSVWKEAESTWTEFDNYIGDYVEACSEDEAISLYMDCLRDQAAWDLAGEELDAELRNLESHEYRATLVEW